MIVSSRVEAAYQTALAALLKERHSDGYWVGELSTSALSTATAVMALHLVQKHATSAERHDELVRGGLDWLVKNQNADGGWGDTTISFSNISTTMLCRAALHMTAPSASAGSALSRAEDWLFSRYGKSAAQLAQAVRARYGRDRTFATPILTTCALAGLVDWKEVPPLPFELAVFPQSWFRLLRLHVVSYALPALIAIGQCIYHHKKPWNPFTRLFRALSRRRSLRVLEAIQPTSGGFLEAIPLTSFVTLSLAACGLADHDVTKNGARFLVNAVRPDGSWAIDSDLSTWVTTLAVNALAAAGEIEHLPKLDEVRDWLLRQQYRERHPYTGAAPGGWAWTPLPGGVPDADDTSGALLALLNSNTRDASWQNKWEELVSEQKFEELAALLWEIKWRNSYDGRAWLGNLQNTDGGWPTFCRGWGRLPFDRSGCDLTAHAIRALLLHREWYDRQSTGVKEKSMFTCLEPSEKLGFRFLENTQRLDGSWLPLWFGNQHAPNDENPTYGTARVLAAYRDLGMMYEEPARRGVAWLLSAQNADGGWGGTRDTPSSMEETALAVEILLDAHPLTPDPSPPGGEGRLAAAVNKGLVWLVEQVESGGLYKPSPIGFYFAKLWYFEKLYPIIFSVAALGRARRRLQDPPERMQTTDHTDGHG